jgi:hypothetical protein
MGGRFVYRVKQTEDVLSARLLFDNFVVHAYKYGLKPSE